MERTIPPFEPITTDRLIIRGYQPGDLDALVERRNHPETARYQDWEVPYSRERARERLEEVIEMGGPQPDRGWSATVTLKNKPEVIVGDLAYELRWGAETASVGYTFHPDHWGRGYATEATAAIIAHAFDAIGVGRIESSLHPANPASARVLENCGLLFEGETRQSFWVGDEVSDDWLYGMLRADWDRWRNRPRNQPRTVTLEQVTADTAEAVGDLTVHKSQERFVATMARNFRNILFPPLIDRAPLVPWYRAVVADGDIAGFLLAAEPGPTNPDPRLVALLIDRFHQRRGVGSAALAAYERFCRDRGDSAIVVGWAEGIGAPGPFFRSRGYEPTGETEPTGELKARKPLS